MVWVTEVRTLSDYRLWLRFSDGAAGEVDLRTYIFADARPIVAELSDPALFASVEVELDTVVWANGLDFASEFLYERMLKDAVV